MPALTPVTLPLLPIVAIAENSLLHIPPPIASDSVIAAPTGTLLGPVIADISGAAITFTVTVLVQPKGME